MSFRTHGVVVALVSRFSLLGPMALAALLVGLLASPTASSAEGASSDPDAEALQRVLVMVEHQPRAGARRTDLSLALNELRNAMPRLSPTHRDQAERVLARPTNQSILGGGDGIISAFPLRHTALCDTALCVRYTTSGAHATTATHAQAAFATARNVHQTYVRAGYRPPLTDANARDDGGGPQTDIYIGNVGGQAGYYGYCTSDEGGRRTWAYCVVDNDYAASEFGTRNSPVENLKVTLAHEYFHAVQFGYDSAESRWLMEATATWAEDEIFDAVNDNVAYLGTSSLTRPSIPLNSLNPALFPYGNWIFFRHLGIRFPRSRAGMPLVVRQIWRTADAAPGAPNLTGVAAVRRVLNRKDDFESSVARFGSANRRSRSTYDEGRQQRYPVAPLARSYKLAPRSRVAAKLRLSRLATGTVRAVPTRGLRNGRWKLTVEVRSRSPRFAEGFVTVRKKPGGFLMKRVRLGRNGVGRVTVPFSRGRVRWVETTLANGHPTRSGIAVGYRLKPRM